MTAHGSSRWASEHLHHFAHFGDRLAQLALDAHLQGHGAAGAGAVQAGCLRNRALPATGADAGQRAGAAGGLRDRGPTRLISRALPKLRATARSAHDH